MGVRVEDMQVEVNAMGTEGVEGEGWRVRVTKWTPDERLSASWIA